MVGGCASTAQFVMSEAVEGIAVGIVRRVPIDGLRRDFDDDAGWNVLAVGEGYALEDAAAEGSYQEVSESNCRV